jgi:electron transfer flavoprotein alpha/beta subunit
VACVLVHIEAEGDRPSSASLGALGTGRRLASRFGAALYAVVLTTAELEGEEDPDAGSTVRIGPVDPASLGGAPLVGELSRGGADKIVFVTVEHLHQPALWATAGSALAAACSYLRPLLVVVPTSRGGHDIAPRLAARMGAAYIPDAELDLSGAVVSVQRKVYGTHTRRWTLDDLDRAAVIAVAPTATPAAGDDDAEVMLLSVATRPDERVASEHAPPPAPATSSRGRRASTGVPIPTADTDPGTGPTPLPEPKRDAEPSATQPLDTLEMPIPKNVAVLVRGLLSGPGTRAAAPIGPAELAAIRAAVAVGRSRGVTVAAIAAGPPGVHDRALAVALAAGCQRAIRVDATIADEIDYLGLAQLLAQAVRKVDAGLVFCGDRSSDEATGVIGPAVAEMIDAAHLTGVETVAAGDGDTVLARRGSERHRVSPTAVLCIAAARSDGAPAEKLASIEPVAEPTIELMTLDELGLDPRILLHRRTSAGAITASANVETLPGVPIPDFGPEPG